MARHGTVLKVYTRMSNMAWFDGIVRRDVSYGIYLYGFPITPTVVMLPAPHLPTAGVLFDMC